MLGFGSVQGPDRFGWEVVAALGRDPVLRGLPDGTVALRRYASPDASLLDDLRGAALGIVVDALVCDQSPGRLLRLQDLEELAGLKALSSHDLGLAELLLLGRTLGDLPSRLVVHGVTIDAALTRSPQASHDAPEPDFAASVRAAVQAIVRDIEAHLDATGKTS